MLFYCKSLSENVFVVHCMNILIYYPVTHFFGFLHSKMYELKSIVGVAWTMEIADAASLVFSSYLLLHDH